MTSFKARVRCLLPLLLGACGLFALIHAWSGKSQPAVQAASKEESATIPLPPAARLVIHVGEYKGKSADLLKPAAAAWEQAAPTHIVLNRTPRIYQSEPVRTLPPPALEVRAFRSDGKLVLRMRWNDATRDAPEAPPSKTGSGGDSKKIYKRPTGETDSFADAMAVMVPERWTGKEFPSLVMGDRHTAARIYYWNASRGAEELQASGRATQQSTGKTFAHDAQHKGGRWSVTAVIDEPPQGCPIAFAVWDGHERDRDGLKCVSIWYVLKWQ
jgi:hypothetical protein